MSRQYRKLCGWFFGLLLLFLSYSSLSASASYQADPMNDVRFLETLEKGNFMPSIDIKGVSNTGSQVDLEFTGDLPTEPNNNLSLTYLALFSDDGDPTTWEAAFEIQFQGASFYHAHWIIGDPLETNNWQPSIFGIHYRISNNHIIWTWSNYPQNGIAKVVVKTTAKVQVIDAETQSMNTNVYFDWAPDSYDNPGFQASLELNIPLPSSISSSSSSHSSSCSCPPCSCPPAGAVVFPFLSIILALPIVSFLYQLHRSTRRKDSS